MSQSLDRIVTTVQIPTSELMEILRNDDRFIWNPAKGRYGIYQNDTLEALIPEQRRRQERIEEGVRTGHKFSPVVLGRNPDGSLTIEDGSHRIVSAFRRGVKTMDVRIVLRHPHGREERML